MLDRYTKRQNEIKNTYNNHAHIKNTGRDVRGTWGGSSIDTSWTPWAQKDADDRILSDPFYRR